MAPPPGRLRTRTQFVILITGQAGEIVLNSWKKSTVHCDCYKFGYCFINFLIYLHIYLFVQCQSHTNQLGLSKNMSNQTKRISFLATLNNGIQCLYIVCG